MTYSTIGVLVVGGVPGIGLSVWPAAALMACILLALVVGCGVVLLGADRSHA